MEKNNELQVQVLGAEVAAMQTKFEMAVATAHSIELANNACASFQSVCAIKQLRDALTDEVMNAVFMPLMNTTIGFRTDHDPNKKRRKYNPSTRQYEELPAAQPYSIPIVRDCIIDAICIGLMPTGNQFNIISERMYPTKEGYTALLKRIGCKYYIDVAQDTKPADSPFAEIPCKISYMWNGEKSSFSIVATVKKDSTSSADQLRGKAERRAKKALYEYLTGCDFGDADEESAIGTENAAQEQRKAERAARAAMAEDVDFEEQAQQQAQGGWREKAKVQQQQEGECPI